MLGLLSVAALLGVAGEVDVDAVVVTETRGGEAPQAQNPNPTPGFVGILAPALALPPRRPDLEVRFEYGPRIFWRQPNELSRMSPLILHVATLSAAARSSPTVTTTYGASVSAGEVDYTTLSQVLAPSGAATPPATGTPGPGPSVGSPQATLPSVTNLLSASASAGAELEATRTWRLGAKLEVGHRRPLGAAATQTMVMGSTLAPFALLEQTSVLVTPTATVSLTRRDNLVLTTPLSQQWYAGGTDIFIVTPQVGWQTRLSPTSGLRLAGGVAYGRYYLGPSSLMPGSGSSVVPVGNAAIGGVLMRHRSVSMQGEVGAGVDYFVDPVLGAPALRGSTSARWSVSFEPDWSVGIEGAFATSLRGRPLAGYPDETVSSVALPVRYRAADNLAVEFGGRWSERAPHLKAPDFAFRERQLWAYVMLTFTTRETSRHAAPAR